MLILSSKKISIQINKILYLIILFLSILAVGQSEISTALAQGGTTYYISPTGDDNNSGTSVGDPWATISYALGGWDNNQGPAQIQPGDTLILMDGVYYQSISPRISGEPGSPIIIRAQNDGMVTLDGENARSAIDLSNNVNYIVIEGIIVKNGPRVRGQHVIGISGSHNILRRVSAYDANTDDNNSVVSISGDHNLLEDCVAAGSGRKMIYIYQGQYNTIRRCLTDWREWDGRDANQSWPWGDNIELYQGDYNIVENSISYGHAAEYGISLLANGTIAGGSTCIGNKVLGSMSINTGRTHDGNLVFWGPDPNTPPLTQVQPTIRPQPSAHRPDHVAQFNNPHLRSGVSFFGGSGLVENNLLQDIFVWGSAGHGLSVYDSHTDGIPNVRNNIVNRGTIINNGIDLGQNLDVDNPSQVSLTNSFVEGDPAHNGEGARLQYRYIDGELMDGTNGHPAQPLWPWPMDDRIQAELGYSVEAKIRPLVDELTAGFVIEATPSTQTIRAGDTVITTLKFQPTTSLTEPITVTADNPYRSLAVQLSETSLTNLPQSVTLTFTDLHDSSFAEATSYTIPIIIASRGITRTIAVKLFLNADRVYLPLIHN